jgi:WS/DGAT/MGAT family acyltransferase
MHVAWRGVFAAPEGRRPTLEALRRSVAARLQHLPRFRQRVAMPPLGLGEPYWVDDPDFDIRWHVNQLSPPSERVGETRFAALCDGVLSRPLERDRPLWDVHLVPRLEDDRVGLVVKIHHAMVDGKSAVELALLLFDLTPEVEDAPPDDWQPAPRPGSARLALRAMADGVGESLRDARSVARAAAPGSGGRLTHTLRRTALAVGDDLLRPAPSSFVNVPIGPRRALVHHRARMSDLMAAKRAAGVTLNDVCLAAVAGAMRELALARGRTPRALKAMVPVSVRADAERSELGNRITFAFVDLPVNLRSPRARVEEIHHQTSAFKASGRPAGTELVLSALGRLPVPVQARAARIAGSARVYNLVVSNVPGPNVPVYMLGSELIEAYPVVPISDEHALSIGIFTYREHAHFGLYADPGALPDVHRMPDALNAAVLALARPQPRRRPQARHPVVTRNGRAPAAPRRRSAG